MRWSEMRRVLTSALRESVGRKSRRVVTPHARARWIVISSALSGPASLRLSPKERFSSLLRTIPKSSDVSDSFQFREGWTPANGLTNDADLLEIIKQMLRHAPQRR